MTRIHPLALSHAALIVAAFVAQPASLAWAQTAAQTAAPPPATAESRLVAQFADLAGSRENIASIIGGLRSGSTITLTRTVSIPAGKGRKAARKSISKSDSITFAVPTKPMGYGNIRIALSLAKALLASQGIANPTPLQLQTALVGAPGSGSGTPPSVGILQMRADGMGWGKIANTLGIRQGASTNSKQGSPATEPPAGAPSARGVNP